MIVNTARMIRGAAIAAVGMTLMLALPVSAFAQRLTLNVTPGTISFPSSDPDAVPLVAAAPAQVTYRVRQNTGQPWTLTVLAGGDLISGLATVDIANVGWVAAPSPPFQNGTLSKTVAQRLASGTGNVNPAEDGQVTFRLANSWNYTAGIYTQVVIFTLSAP